MLKTKRKQSKLSDDIARALLDERKRSGITQLKIAKRCKMSPACLSRIENGKRTSDINTLERIADAVGVQLWEVVKTVSDERAARRPRQRFDV